MIGSSSSLAVAVVVVVIAVLTNHKSHPASCLLACAFGNYW
jgi:hypothetical protein